MMNKRYKSLMFVPASRLDLAAQAHKYNVDAVILDLEDGVASEDKNIAREKLASTVDQITKNGKQVLVRINPLENGGQNDLHALSAEQVPAILLPKIIDKNQIFAVIDYWKLIGKNNDDLSLLPMIECPEGMFNANEIAKSCSKITALIFGSEDFAAQAGLDTTIKALTNPAQMVALAAAASDLPAYGLPGSIANYHDMGLFEETVKMAKAIGYSGSLCIHPRQVQVANKIFKPTREEITWAQTIIKQSETDGANGSDLGMIDAPVLTRARALLENQ